MEFMINLNLIDDIKKFIGEAAKVPADIDLCKEHYVIDGKSIMGIMTLDLANPVKVKIHADKDTEYTKEFIKNISDLIVKEEQL